jgi:2-polyprenyl-3-methyl-5-hydroxy-6-metoxy-1,4-benzoquinol methylase
MEDEEARKRLEQAWVANADAWSDAVRGDAIESRRLVTNRAVIDTVLALGGTTVLDVGCGEGWLCRQLASGGRTVTGFDGSARLIELAAQRGGGVYSVSTYDEFVNGPTAAGVGYDVIVCNYSLFWETLQPLLAALRLPLRRGAAWSYRPFIR